MADKKLTLITDIPTPYRVYFFEALANELSKRDIGFEVVFMAKSVPIRYWNLDNSSWKFKFTFLKGVHFHFGMHSFHFNPGFFLSILRKPSNWLVVGGAWNMPTSYIAILLNKLFNKRKSKNILWAEANKYSMTYKNSYVNLFRNYLLKRVDIFAVPGSLAEDTIKHEWGVFGKQFAPLPNTIDEEKFFKNKKESIESTISCLLGGSDFIDKHHDRVMLWPARLHEGTKGIINFLSSIITILNGSDIKIIIAGDGPDKNTISKWLKENMCDKVLLIGQKDQEEMLALYSIADVLLLPSLKDPNPLSVIEGLWSGLPLFISKHCGNHNEAVKEKYNGWVVDPLSEKSMRSAFLDLNEAPKSQLELFGRNSLEIARNNFDSVKVVNKFIDMLTNNL